MFEHVEVFRIVVRVCLKVMIVYLIQVYLKLRGGCLTLINVGLTLVKAWPTLVPAFPTLFKVCA